MTQNGSYKARFEIVSSDGKEGWAEYSTFNIGSESSEYKLSISWFAGNVSNMMNYHNAQKFTTVDQENENWSDGSKTASTSI